MAARERRVEFAVAVAADPPVEDLLPRVQRSLRVTRSGRWLVDHAAAVGIAVLALITLALIALRAS